MSDTKAFMPLSPSIFKAYDIRGVVPSTLDEPVARALGLAFGTKALAQAQLAQYFSGQRRRFELPLDLTAGTPFQQAVWRALLSIDAGNTCSYADLAQRMGRPNSARAVGAAVGRNRLSVIVPCHRVVGKDGQLTGYAGGLPRKRALLALEGVA